MYLTKLVLKCVFTNTTVGLHYFLIFSFGPKSDFKLMNKNLKMGMK